MRFAALTCLVALLGCGGGSYGRADASSGVDAHSALGDTAEAHVAQVDASDVAGEQPGASDGPGLRTDAGDVSGAADVSSVADVSSDNAQHGDPSWSTSPHADAIGTLRAVWGSGTNDVWAVGERKVILHWNGATWSTVLAPDPTARDLSGVWGSASNDVWAVGSAGILHWDGAAWTPSVIADPTLPRGVWGSAPGDVWVVGARGIILHWDGAAWSTRVPASDSGSFLSSVSGNGPADIWAVGDSGIAHWNGQTWTLQPSPPVTLTGVWASGPKDVWAVGGGSPDILHWNGTEWSIGGQYGSPDVVHAVWSSGPDNGWAVGYNTRGQGLIILHRNGANWSSISPENVAGLHSKGSLYGVWGSGPSDVWAVGGGMILHFGR